MSETDTLPVEQAQDTTPPVVEDAAAQGEEPAVERDVAEDTLEIPDSSVEGGTVKYVPASALAGARGELRELKAKLATATEGSAKAQQLEQQIQQLNQHVQTLSAKAQAYDAALAAQQQRPQETAPEDDAEAIELAQVLDLYTPEGKPDVAKARKAMGIVDKRAESKAQQHVAPLAHHTVTQQSQIMLARAKNTTAPNGAKADPQMLEAIWSRLDPQLTATQEGAKQAWVAALGYSAAMAQQGKQPEQRPRTATGQFASQQEIPPPLHTEKAGGKDTPPSMALSEQEREYCKREGITEAEYLKSASNAPWLRR